MMVDRENKEQVAWFNAMTEACEEGKVKKVEELLKSPHANVNLYDPGRHRGPLHWACVNNRVKVVKMLFAAGAKNHLEDRQGLDPIQHAIAEGFHQVVRACLIAGVNTNYQRYPQASCPMSKAAIEGDEAMVALLIKYGGVIEPYMIEAARDHRGDEWASYLEQRSMREERKALAGDKSILPGTPSPKVRKGL